MAQHQVIYREKVQDFLVGLNGKMFSVDFIKKDGSIRTLNGRLAVKKYVKGTGQNHAARLDLPYISIWEAPKPQDYDREGQKKYKSVNLATIQSIRAKGKELTVM